MKVEKPDAIGSREIDKIVEAKLIKHALVFLSTLFAQEIVEHPRSRLAITNFLCRRRSSPLIWEPGDPQAPFGIRIALRHSHN